MLFTHGDCLEGRSIEDFLKESQDLQDVVARCNGLYHVFNNKLKDDSQVLELLHKSPHGEERRRTLHQRNIPVYREDDRRKERTNPERARGEK